MPFEVKGPITYDASRLYFPKSSSLKAGASLDTLNHVVISFVQSKEFQRYLREESDGQSRVKIDARVIKDHIFVKINGKEEKEFTLLRNKVERTANRILEEAKKVWEEKESSLSSSRVEPLVIAQVPKKDSKVPKLLGEIARLKQQLEALVTNPRQRATDAIEIDRLREAIRSASLEAFTLEQANRELSSTNTHLIDESAASLEALQAQERSHASDLGSKTSQIKALEAQIAHLESTFAADHSASTIQIAHLRHRLASEKQASKALSIETASLSSQVGEMRASNTALASDLASARSAHKDEALASATTIRDLTIAFEKEKARLEGLIATSTKEQSELQAQIEKKQGELIELERRQVALCEELRSSKEENREKILALDELRSLISTLRDQLKAAKASAEQKQGSIVSLAAEMAEQEIQHERAVSQLEEEHESALASQAESLSTAYSIRLGKEKAALAFADRLTRGVWHFSYSKQILELRRALDELITATEAKKAEERRKKEALEKEFIERETRLIENQRGEIIHREKEIAALRQDIESLEKRLEVRSTSNALALTATKTTSKSSVIAETSRIIDYANYLLRLKEMVKSNPIKAITTPTIGYPDHLSIPRPISLKVERAVITGKPVTFTKTEMKQLKKLFPGLFSTLESMPPSSKPKSASIIQMALDTTNQADRLKSKRVLAIEDHPVTPPTSGFQTIPSRVLGASSIVARARASAALSESSSSTALMREDLTYPESFSRRFTPLDAGVRFERTFPISLPTGSRRFVGANFSAIRNMGSGLPKGAKAAALVGMAAAFAVGAHFKKEDPKLG